MPEQFTSIDIGLIKSIGISKIPPGALASAKNVFVKEIGRISGRYGFESYREAFGKILSIFDVDGEVYLSTEKNNLYRLNNGSFDLISKFKPISNSKGVFVNQKFFLLGQDGAYYIENNQLKDAGVPQALPVHYTINSQSLSGTNYLLEPGSSINYRFLWVRRTRIRAGYDSQSGNFVYNMAQNRGAPSSAVSVICGSNEGTGKLYYPSFRIPVPSSIQSNEYYLEIYRTLRSADNNGNNVNPGDVMYLVGEVQYENERIITYNDNNNIETSAQATLYTNGSILEANHLPPRGKSIITHNERILMSGVMSRNRFQLRMVAQPINNEKLTLESADGDYSYDFLALPYSDLGDIYEGRNYRIAEHTSLPSNPSASDYESYNRALYETAVGLCFAINTQTDGRFIAFFSQPYLYASGISQEIVIWIEESESVGNPFYVLSPVSSAFPYVPAASNLPNSVSDRQPNAIYYSKQGVDVEAFPLTNYLQIGGYEDILNIAVLVDYIFVFKKDGIFFSASRDVATASFSVFSRDTLISINSIAVSDTFIYCLTEKGITRISSSGVKVISNDTIKEIVDSIPMDALIDSFGTYYQKDQIYILSYAGIPNDDTQTHHLVYSEITGAWSMWEMPTTASRVVSDKIYFAKNEGSNNYLAVQTENGYDDKFDADVISVDSDTKISVRSTREILADDGVSLSFNSAVILSAVSISGGFQIEFENSEIIRELRGKMPHGVSIVKRIDIKIELSPLLLAGLGSVVNCYEANLIFPSGTEQDGLVGFKTNYDSQEDIVNYSVRQEEESDLDLAKNLNSFKYRLSVPDGKRQGQLHFISIHSRNVLLPFVMLGVSLMFRVIRRNDNDAKQ